MTIFCVEWDVKPYLVQFICFMDQFWEGLPNIESVTDHSEEYCRNYGRNLVNYVAIATLNYSSRHLVIIVVLSQKR